jgi:hypothetical protein
MAIANDTGTATEHTGCSSFSTTTVSTGVSPCTEREVSRVWITGIHKKPQ